IFDLDGTLWDSTAACATGWNKALTQIGHDREVTRKDIESIMGLPHSKIFEKIFPGTSDAEREKLAVECYRGELEAIRKAKVGLYPGVEEGLKKLVEKFPLFIVSNCMPDYIDMFFDITSMQPLFKDALCHGHTGKTKAENIRLIVTRHKLESPAYVGDTAGDQSAAGKAGVPY